MSTAPASQGSSESVSSYGDHGDQLTQDDLNVSSINTDDTESVTMDPVKRRRTVQIATKAQLSDQASKVDQAFLNFLEKSKNEDDEASLMAQSYVPSLRRLSARDRMIADIKIKQILLDLEHPTTAPLQSNNNRAAATAAAVHPLSTLMYSMTNTDDDSYSQSLLVGYQQPSRVAEDDNLPRYQQLNLY